MGLFGPGLGGEALGGLTALRRLQVRGAGPAGTWWRPGGSGPAACERDSGLAFAFHHPKCFLMSLYLPCICICIRSVAAGAFRP